MQCPKCNSIVDDNQTVCPKCRKVLLLECPNCHSLGESAICEKCGYTILIKCAKCSKIVPVTQENCSKCGFPVKTSVAYQECESDEYAALNIVFGSLKTIKRQLKSKELYTKFFVKLKNLLIAQVKGFEGKFIIYDDKFTLNFNKELSLATSSNKAVRAALKIINAFSGLNSNIVEELGNPLNLNLTIIKKNSEQLLDFISQTSNVKPLNLKKDNKKYLKGMQVVLDQYVCDLVGKDYKTDSLYSIEDNGTTVMYYEVLLDKYVLPPTKSDDESTIKATQKLLHKDSQEEQEQNLYAFKPFDINAKCSFERIDVTNLFDKLENIEFEKGGKILALRSQPELSVRLSELIKYFERRELNVLRVSCTEEMNFKPWGFFEALFRDYMQFPFHNGFIDLGGSKSANSDKIQRYMPLVELLYGKPIKAMTPEDARFAYMEQFGNFLRAQRNTLILVEGFEFLDDTSVQTLDLYFDTYRNIVPNIVFLTNVNTSVHSKFKGLLRTKNYTEISLMKSSMDACLGTLKSDATDFIQSFYFEKIKENFKGSYLYFENAIKYLKESGVLIEFENKLLVKNKKSVILPQELQGLCKARIKHYSKNMDLSLILAFSTILGARIDFKTLTQLGIKDVEKNARILEECELVSIKNDVLYINNFALFLPLLKASLKKDINVFLAKTVIAQLGKGLDDTTMAVAMGLLQAYKEEYLTLWKNSQLAIKTGDFDAYLKNCLSFLSLVEHIDSSISLEEIEENKKEVFNNILMSLYAYSPAKIYFIENILLMDAIKNGDNEKIVKLSNLMLQGALISANYTDALGLLHNIYSRMAEPTLVVDGVINTKFLLLSLVNIEILYNIGNFKQAIEVGEEVLSVLTPNILEKVKPASFSINLFVTHLLETFRLVALAKIYVLDNSLDEFFTKVENSIGAVLPEKGCITALQDYLAGKVYSTGNVEEASAFSKVVYLLLQEFSEFKGDYKRFAQNIYQAKLLAIDIQQRELRMFCDLLIGYAYAQMGYIEKAESIYDDIISFAETSALFNIIVLTKYLKTMLKFSSALPSEGLMLVNDALALIKKFDDQSKVFYVLFEKKYIEAVKSQEMSSVDLEIEEQKILQFKDALKILFE